MNGYLAITDLAWFTFLRERGLREVNFWQPSGGRAFRAIPPGAPFFFKLKRPHHAIGGFGFFAHHSVLPAWLAWQTFGEGNGAPTEDAMHRNIGRLRRSADPRAARAGTYPIGCVILSDCVFFGDDDLVRVPADFSPNIVQGKTYDLRRAEGARIWRECQVRAAVADPGLAPAPAADDRTSDDGARYGTGVLVQPRLGQGAFRVAVLDAYERSCAVSTEHSLPVLEAAHIRGYADGGRHDVRNGICLRSDIHRLFDAGYVTVDEDYRFVVSDRLRQDYDNGKVYYERKGDLVKLPPDRRHWPGQEQLAWHREQRFIA